MPEPLLAEWTDLPAPGDREVQVFALRADDDPALLVRAYPLLSVAERERAARFRVEHARQDFIVGRAVLRALLSGALGTRPELLPLQADAFGKPFVPGMHSNVSHSRGLVYIALCRTAAVGVDVEWVDPSLEALELAQANFSPEEAGLVAGAATSEERAHVFCRLWTRKEAVVKAHGRGLRVAPREIRVPLSAGGIGTIEADPVEKTPEMHFHLHELWAPEGFLAALATAGSSCAVTLRHRK